LPAGEQAHTDLPARGMVSYPRADRHTIVDLVAVCSRSQSTLITGSQMVKGKTKADERSKAMKTTEEIQQAFSGRRQSPPSTNGEVGNSARKRSSGTVLLGLGIIFGVLLITITVISGCSQDTAQPYEQGATEGGICDLISAQISDLIRAYEGTSVHITVEGGGDSYTLTSGRIVLVLRCLQSSLSLDEMTEVRENILDRAMIDLGEPSHPIAIASPYPQAGREEPPPGLPYPDGTWRIVAFGFAIGDDWIPVSHYGSTGLTTEDERVVITSLHQEALEWFRQRLVSQHGSQGHVSNKHEIP